MKSTHSLKLLYARFIALTLCSMVSVEADETVTGNLIVTGHADVVGNLGVTGNVEVDGKVGLGTQAPKTTLDVVGSFRINTNNDQSTHQRHGWRRFSWGGNADLNWKKVALLTPRDTGSYNGIAFEGRIFDHQGSHGWIRGISIPFSGFTNGLVGDSRDYTAEIAQGFSPYKYVRLVRLAPNQFELQVRQAADWRWMEVEWRITGDYAGLQSIVYYDNAALVNGSADTGGEIVANFTHNNSVGTLWAGKIGIGTSAPSAALDVVGSAKVSADLNVGGNMLLTGNIIKASGAVTLGGSATDKQLTVDSSTGNVGVGGQYSGSKLYANKFSTDPTTGAIGARFDTTLSSSASTALTMGLYVQSAYDVSSTGNNTGGLIAVRGISRNNSATHNVTSANGVQGEVWQLGAGSITWARALVGGRPYFADFGGTITNAAALYLDAQKIAGVANGYGVYQVGPSDINYFAGGVGIGTSTPATGTKLDVNGTVQISGDVKVKNSAVIRISPAGDIGMGDFMSGTNPAN